MTAVRFEHGIIFKVMFQQKLREVVEI